ncbi:hypothetical protein GN956_G16273 [Arapaima gigas]
MVKHCKENMCLSKTGLKTSAGRFYSSNWATWPHGWITRIQLLRSLSQVTGAYWVSQQITGSAEDSETKQPQSKQISGGVIQV